ncbi:hypothetical protein CL6EHI_089440 [Entamoeba histolytica]|uniref:Uncharacterized protein n=2 Tax=Entamoeba histolytica TaxID=5759 RepID=B1N505_ENTH1|nr:hypothetical protein EHI_089440 [Entamoeba histolytica HM-1:IMSS]EDS88954.1 hypothetical protein EHI_089440 [Entamoeba histolytica HM-1:IMSS]GAT99099.1 hypothetical protein CL6EHI_089440 [Entamoeba histolytica]|eukprot:XP_001914271.1 hypothetical protein EHI_089440 [Entamoeba histolytica HM-1:IMSS]
MVENWCSTETNKAEIEYLAASNTKGTNAHAHVFFKLKDRAKVHKKPVAKINNIEYKLFFTPVTEHKKFDGSFQAIIKYLKNQNKKHGSESTFDEIGKEEAIKGKVGNNLVEQALSLENLKEAEGLLRQASMTWYLNNVKKFRDVWREQHDNKQTNRINIKLRPWKEDNILVKNARAWLQGVKLSKQKRVKTLVLLGDTRIGKTEFVNDLLKGMKVDEFRGHFMFDGHDEYKNYDIRLFDDANLKEVQWFEFKALISTRGETITMNIKYDHVNVTSLPTIIVMNTKNWDMMKRIAKENDDLEWLEKNTAVLYSREPLFERPKEIRKTIEELKKQYGDLDPAILEMFDEEDIQPDKEEDGSEDSSSEFQLQEPLPAIINPEATLRLPEDDFIPEPEKRLRVPSIEDDEELASRWPRYGDEIN